MTPFIGFAPDLDPATPGVITDCTAIIPSTKGMKAAPGFQATVDTTGIIGGVVVSAALVRKLDDSRRIFGATQTSIQELVSGAWVDRSRVGNYTGSVDTKVRFAQFGDVTLSVNGAQNMQASTAGAFSDITQAPAARCICTASDFALAAGTSLFPDGWFCSDIFNHVTWTPASNNQAASGRLVSTPGPIKGLVSLRQDAVAYKERSMYLGRYIDPTIKWSWTPVSTTVGALSQEAVIDIDGAHVFLGVDNFYSFDGANIVPIGNPVREWFIQNSDPSTRFRTFGTFDRTNRIAYWFFNGVGSTITNVGLAYHVDQNRWGKVNYAIRATLNFVNPAIVIDSLTNPANTYTIPVDSPFYLGGATSLAVFDVTNTLVTVTGPSQNWSFTSGDLGDDGAFKRLSRVRPHYLTKPASSTLEHLTKDESGAGFNVVGSSSYSPDSSYDVLYESRFHRVSVSGNGNMEIVGITPEITAVSQ